jgi:hypothetical protein
VNFHFSVGDNLASHVGDFLWFGPFRRFQKLFFRTPVVYLFILGSYIYHDWLWWPFVGKRLMKVLETNTDWGKFFASYPGE